MSNSSKTWKALENHSDSLKNTHIKDLFKKDPSRFEKFNITHQGVMLDFSKNIITEQTLDLLIRLAKDSEIETWRERMFSGEKINITENRSVLHTALRGRGNSLIIDNNEDIRPLIELTLAKMKAFSTLVRNSQYYGHTKKPINKVINIGIGGSDLGPRLVYNTLKNHVKNDFPVSFVANIDGSDIQKLLKDSDPETTLFIMSSKSFSTPETLTNANTAKKWLIESLGDHKCIKRHFIGVTSNINAATDFGIDNDNIFPMWDWVGGRYSLWSSVGLSICIGLGYENFDSLLCGALSIDTHFRETPLENNIPVIMALIGIWYRNFWGAQSYAILPYSHDLALLPDYLQQLDMESNGKGVSRDNHDITISTGPVLFGSTGTNAQHSFFQLLHQGTNIVPCDFIAPIKPPSNLYDHHKILLANMLAQSRALMRGQTLEEAHQDPQKVFKGSRPSNTILLNCLDAFHLGMLLAVYEHKIFVQGIIWNINSFDQNGVELGKTMVKEISSAHEDTSKLQELDSSTVGLFEFIQAHIKH